MPRPAAFATLSSRSTRPAAARPQPAQASPRAASSRAPFLLAACLTLLGTPAWSAPTPGAPSGDAPYALNLNTVLSEQEDHAAALEPALIGFLAEVRAGEFTDRYTVPRDVERFAFFFDGIRRLGVSSESTYHAPLVLRSYSPDGASYLITVAFSGERDGAPFIYKIVEFRALPAAGSYRFTCPFEGRTASFNSTKLGDVTFHHSGPLDSKAAADFAAFRTTFAKQAGSTSGPLDYYCFQSLDELLTSYGFLYDVNKCNFLARDLGFTESAGRVFVTGTGRADYVFGYLGEHLYHNAPNPEELYRPFVTGMSTYYGGYGLTGEGMDELKAQFRAKLASNPEIDFLAEFGKGRGSSVNRHFSYYVMSAFLCQAAVEQHGVEAALRLAYAGPQGERFFPLLEEILGVSQSNFDATIRRLIATS